MKTLTWLKQHHRKNQCGQVAVSVVADIPLENAIKLIGKKGCTKTKDLVMALRQLGFKCPDRCRKMPMPKLAIAQVHFPSNTDYGWKRKWHWVVVDGNKIYDGMYGKSDGTVNWHGGKTTSYLPISERPNNSTEAG